MKTPPERNTSCAPLRRRLFRRGVSCIPLILSAVLPLAGLQAATYYVDSVAGSESNAGTSINAPWKLIGSGSKVNTVVFQPGDQVLFKRGSAWSGSLVPNGNGTSTAGIIFDAYGDPADPPPLINGTGGSAVKLWNKRHFTFQNFEITNNGTSAGSRDGIRLAYTSAQSFAGVRIRNNIIHDVVGYTTRGDTLENYSTAAIYVEFTATASLVSDLIIEGNEIYDVKAMGIHVKPGSFMNGAPEKWMTGFVVRDNTIRNIGCDHIVVQGADAPLIEYNAGYDAGALAAPNANLWIAGMWVCYNTRNSLFQFNEVARTVTQFVGGNGDSMAFDVDYGTVGNHTFQYNYTHENAGGAVLMMPPPINSATKQPYPPADKTIIYRYNISVNDNRANASGRQVIMHTAPGVNSAHIFNNVFYNELPLGLRMSDTGAEYYSNNIFYARSGHYGSSAKYTNNAYYGHNPIVNDPYKVLADPKFVGPLPGAAPVADAYLTTGEIMSVNNIFKLQPGSPCINAGMNITTPVSNGGRDFFNNPLYASTYADIGVHEVPGGVGTQPAAVTYIDSPNVAPLTYSSPISNWTFKSDNLSFDNSTVAVSNTVGSWVQANFTGTNVTFVAMRGPGSGKINVSIDGGTPKLVDLYWPRAMERQEVFQVSGLANTSHTIRVTVAAKNPASTWNGVHVDYFRVHPRNLPPVPTVATVDNPGLTYTGAWTANTAAENGFQKTLHTSSTVGNSVSYTFTGTGIRLYGPRNRSSGNLNVTVNGITKLATAYCPGEFDEVASRLYEVNGLPHGTYTMTAVVAPKYAESLGNSVSIDLVEVLSGEPTASVTVDNPPSAAVVYTGGSWVHSADGTYYGSTKSVTNQVGHYVTFTFTGTGVSLYAKKDSGLGKLNVQIDGGTATSVDCYSTTPLLQQKVFEVTGLAPGVHTLRATVALKNPASLSNNVGLDYFMYQP